jgi:thioredoxin reductase (NADPH)
MIEQAGATLPLVTDAQARSQAGVEHLANTRLPSCVFANGTRLECPTVRQITEQLLVPHSAAR